MDKPTQTKTHEEYWKEVVDFWKGKTTEALQQVEELKVRVFVLEKEIETQRGKTYLEDILRDDRMFKQSSKVCVLACLCAWEQEGIRLKLFFFQIAARCFTQCLHNTCAMHA
jgi:hypothetical protein